jgi:isocitrate dehydrogenase
LNLKDVIKPQIFKLETTIEPDKLGKKVATPAQRTYEGKKISAYQTDLSFEIAEVYAGDKFDDTCITGIALNGYSKVY